MRLVFAGTPSVALPSLRALHDSEHELLAVVTRPDTVAGRGRKVRRSPVAEFAAEHGIEVLTPRRADDPEFLERLRALNPDCCPVVAYGAMLRQSTLEIPRHGWVNLHFSLLPAYRGAAPVQAAIRAGEELTGASTFQIVPQLDAGPVYGVVTEPVGERDTAGALLERLAESGSRLLVSTVDGIEDGSLEARPQAAEQASYAAKIEVADAEVDFDQPAAAVDRLLRSVTPDPGGWATLDGQRVKLGPVTPTEAESLSAGEILVGRKEVLVGTATNPVRLSEVQAPGKRRMNAVDWARGAKLADTSRFGS